MKECKCHIYPFDDGCYDFCTGKILRFASALILQVKFGLSPQLSEKVHTIASDDRLTTLSDFKKKLNETEFAELENKLKIPGPKGVDWIKTEFREFIREETAVPV